MKYCSNNDKVKILKTHSGLKLYIFNQADNCSKNEYGQVCTGS